MTTKIEIQDLQHDHVEPDPRNPRQACDEVQLTELANDIAVRGILQPIVARPHPDKKGRFMIVFGERRWRAAGMVDMPTVPCIVRQYDSELAVLEDQIAENGKRADVHPLEEADAYRRLHEEHGREVDEIAELTGKSKAYVYAAMKLCALIDEARKAFLGNRIDKSIALLIARLPEQQQPQATKQILAGRWGGEVMSYRDARDYIQRDFILELGRAPFNINDATLVPAAGTCGECPKRTGNQQELFADVCSEKAGDNRCTDPACFKSKSDAHWKRSKEQFKAEGKQVLEGKDAAEAGSYRDKKFADLNDYCQEAGKTYKQLLGRKAGDAIAAIAKTDTGAVRELVDRKQIPALLKAAGVKPPRGMTGPTPKDKEKRKEEKRDQALEAAVVARVHEEIIDRASAAPVAESLDMWRLMARMAIRQKGGYGVTPTLEQVLARRQGTLMQVLAGDKADEAPADVKLVQLVDKLETVAELRAVIFELLLGGVGSDIFEIEPDENAPKKGTDDYRYYRAQEQSDLLDAIEVLDVDVKALTKDATKAFEAAELAKAEAKKAPKPKKQLDGELAIPHKAGCELERFVFVAAGEGVAYHPRKGGKMSVGAGAFTERKCPTCDSGVTTPALPAKAKAQAKNGVAPVAEATS